jgi:hypothetical protein
MPFLFHDILISNVIGPGYEDTQMKNEHLIICGLVLCFLSGGNFVRADGPSESEERILVPLRNAGIATDNNSLIGALKNPNKYLASRAAAALGMRQADKRAIVALENAASDSDEALSIISMHSLKRLGDNSWVPLGLTRLNQIKDKALQIQLAVLLAQEGNADGWDIVSKAILDPSYSALGLEAADSFAGKMKSNGRAINLNQELRKLALIASPEAKEKIERKLNK